MSLQPQVEVLCQPQPEPTIHYSLEELLKLSYSFKKLNSFPFVFLLFQDFGLD